jgi:hypothetical protein
VSLQRGNAAVLRRGMQQMRASRWESTSPSVDLPIDDGEMPASRRRQQQLALYRRSQQIDLSSVFHSGFRAGGGCSAASVRRFLVQTAA